MNSSTKTVSARRVELLVRKLESLSMVPEVAAGFLSHLAKDGNNTAALSEIIECDAALTAKVISLANEKGVVFTDDIPSVGEAVAKLPVSVIRDAVLSVKVFQAFDSEFDPDSVRALPRKQLAIHSLAVACCSQEIAEVVLGSRGRGLAFSAGLLHDVGKLAIDEVMPKSFAKIVEKARSQNSALHTVEGAELGVDHTVIGKRLGEKWSLPAEVVNAIWMHHSDVDVISGSITRGKLALVVKLADIVARQCNLGLSGSFDTAGEVSAICKILVLSDDQLEKIRQELPGEVLRRSSLLGLEERGGHGAYCGFIAETASKLANDNTELSQINTKTGAGSAQMSFVSDFLLDFASNEAVSDIAGKFAAKLQRHYQTGPVCVYAVEDADDAFVEMVTVDKSAKCDTVFVDVPSGTAAIPEQLQREFVICDAADHVGWIFEQIDFEMDLSRAKIAPLLAGGRAVGVVVFEPRMPFDAARHGEVFGVVAAIAGGVLGLAVANARGNRLAERCIDLSCKGAKNPESSAPKPVESMAAVKPQVPTAPKVPANLAGVAEMAAGAAHELNNPLAIISGRAQLLFDSESDEEKKKMLKQVKDRTEEMSQIVADLMSYAKPEAPKPETVSVMQLIDDAIKNVTKKHGLGAVEMTLNGVDGLDDVSVDKGQIVIAIANILSNCLDSYKGGNGPIRIDGSCEQVEGSVVIQIIDSGCGMTEDVLSKACEPFFSYQPAGRKRGMGLAQSLRLLQLNKAKLSIASRVEEGTTVTVSLPKS